MLRSQSSDPTRWRALPGGLALLLGAALFAPGAALAQDAVEDEEGPWVNALSVGTVRDQPGRGSGLLTVGIHATSVRPGRVGVDIAVLTLPRILVLGALPLVARGGVVLPVPLGSKVLLLPGAGVGLVGGFGGGGAGFGGGAQGGAAIILAPGGRPLLRAGVNWMLLSGEDEPVTIIEVGLIRRRGG